MLRYSFDRVLTDYYSEKYELVDNNTKRAAATFTDYDLVLRCANCLNGIRNGTEVK